MHSLESSDTLDVKQLRRVILSLKNALVLLDLSGEGVQEMLSTLNKLLKCCLGSSNITTIVSLCSGGWLFDPSSLNQRDLKIRKQILSILSYPPEVKFKPFSEVEAKTYIEEVGTFCAKDKDSPMLKALTGYNPYLLSLVSAKDSASWPVLINT